MAEQTDHTALGADPQARGGDSDAPDKSNGVKTNVAQIITGAGDKQADETAHSKSKDTEPNTPEAARKDGLENTNSQNTSPKDKVCAVTPKQRDLADQGEMSGQRDSVHQRDQDTASPEPPKVCELCDDPNVPAEGHCSECAQDLCSGCIHRHQRMRTVANHTIVIFPQDQGIQVLEAAGDDSASPHSSPRRTYSPSICETEGPDLCQKHKKEELRFFCKNCQLPVCRDCILTVHKYHQTDDISDASASALRDLSSMTAQLQERQHVLENQLKAFQVYKASFEGKAQQVTEMVQSYYNEVTAAVEASFQQLSADLSQCRDMETGRIEAQEHIVHKCLDGINRILSQQTPIFNSPHAVLRQRDVVADALTTIDHNMDKIHVQSSEFFVSRNPRLAKIPEDILGRVGFTVVTSQAPQTSINEITLRRELAFNIWEMNCAKSSVRTIVEGTHGAVWVATPRSIIKIASSVTKDSTHIPDDIVCISAGPDGKLLVSFGQGGAVKLYSNGSWSRGFTIVGRGITSMASREHRGKSEVYVAETPHEDFPSRITVYTAEGKFSYQQQLPLSVLNTNVPQNSDSPRLEGPGLSNTSPPHLKISTMAVGWDGGLCLGDTAGGRVVIIDAQGCLTGEYRGADGRSGCVPRSVCFAGNGQVVVADSAQSSVELVSSDGNLLATLLVREHFQDSGVPTAVAVDSKGRLWVGTSMGHVSAYSFMHREQ